MSVFFSPFFSIFFVTVTVVSFGDVTIPKPDYRNKLVNSHTNDQYTALVLKLQQIRNTWGKGALTKKIQQRTFYPLLQAIHPFCSSPYKLIFFLQGGLHFLPGFLNIRSNRLFAGSHSRGTKPPCW